MAAVAIYRLVSCWLPVLVGVTVYFVSQRSATRATAGASARVRPSVELQPAIAG